MAQLIYPEALNNTVVAYTLTRIATPAYHADPALKELEAEYPGIIDVMIAAMRREFERGRREALPKLWAKTSAVYAAELSVTELEQAVAFYASPAGRRLMLAEQEAISRLPPPNGPVGTQAGAAAGETSRTVLSSTGFEQTAVGRKLAALQPRIDGILGAWSDAPTPEADARVGEAMRKAADRFLNRPPEPVRLRPMGVQSPSGHKSEE